MEFAGQRVNWVCICWSSWVSIVEVCSRWSMFGGRRMYGWKESHCLGLLGPSVTSGLCTPFGSNTVIAIRHRAAAGSSHDLLPLRSRFICTESSVQFSTFQTPNQKVRFIVTPPFSRYMPLFSVRSAVQSLVTFEGEYIIVGLTNLYTTAEHH